MRVWPLAAVLSVLAFAVILILCSDDLITRMGNLTIWSVLVFLSTIARLPLPRWQARLRRGARQAKVCGRGCAVIR